MINAGKYDKKIQIISISDSKDEDGFKSSPIEILIISPYASIKTLKGFTLIQNNTDFSESYTNFTIRYPNKEIKRDMFVKYNNKSYSIEYLNNVNEANIELEIQAKEVTK